MERFYLWWTNQGKGNVKPNIYVCHLVSLSTQVSLSPDPLNVPGPPSVPAVPALPFALNLFVLLGLPFLPTSLCHFSSYLVAKGGHHPNEGLSRNGWGKWERPSLSIHHSICLECFVPDLFVPRISHFPEDPALLLFPVGRGKSESLLPPGFSRFLDCASVKAYLNLSRG